MPDDTVPIAQRVSHARLIDFIAGAYRAAGVPEADAARAADFMARGFAAGPHLGAVMRAAEQAWIAADFPVDAATIKAIADRAAQEMKRTPTG